MLGKHHYSFHNPILEFHFLKIYKEPQKNRNDLAGTLLMIVKVALCTTPRSAVLNLGTIDSYCYRDFQVGGIEMS